MNSLIKLLLHPTAVLESRIARPHISLSSDWWGFPKLIFSGVCCRGLVNFLFCLLGLSFRAFHRLFVEARPNYLSICSTILGISKNTDFSWSCLIYYDVSRYHAILELSCSSNMCRDIPFVMMLWNVGRSFLKCRLQFRNLGKRWVWLIGEISAKVVAVLSDEKEVYGGQT